MRFKVNKTEDGWRSSKATVLKVCSFFCSLHRRTAQQTHLHRRRHGNLVEAPPPLQVSYLHAILSSRPSALAMDAAIGLLSRHSGGHWVRSASTRITALTRVHSVTRTHSSCVHVWRGLQQLPVTGSEFNCLWSHVLHFGRLRRC